MARKKYKYGTRFMKNGSSVCYRYENGKKSSKTLVYSRSKKLYLTPKKRSYRKRY